MRLRATVRVTIPGAATQPDDAVSFWIAFVNHVAPEGAPRPGDYVRFAQEQELRLRQQFPLSMETYLRAHISDNTVIVRTITYASLNIGLDVISEAIDGLGFSADDILELLSRYTPLAVIGSYTPRRGDASLHAKAVGQVIMDNHKEDTASTSTSRIDRIWTIANTSLVIPSLVLLVAAYVIFQTAAGERDRITAAILQERAELGTQRQKLIDRADAQQKGFEDNLNVQMGHFRDLYQLEIEVMKTRLDQIKAPNKQEATPSAVRQ
jgi:hypothetical protein